jgi:hypothetical protein
VATHLFRKTVDIHRPSEKLSAFPRYSHGHAGTRNQRSPPRSRDFRVASGGSRDLELSANLGASLMSDSVTHSPFL